ncbi:hypothetical protein CGRA01v4_04793 [Colletotrichum graminicola]|uniref:Uncharacterized protein n=1 Tax=Colletotrichum graminicola (strain M1.001 / M2 / FGSC 10212) TaxID=645133 RepID=E3QLM3_COLGM|nr:uncharacterized protein GLRG_06736 [Colletotrichum graminicola M1.001]EFQ31761.1 hypothetical protein GLRG_06736 [Colletotrichum graminicola M1.001]WDK13512.1 hypothetical protein CGRA01v4_04793 [Colletotrichum graminicola]
MTTLPLKVKVAIRDHWTKEDSHLQQSLKSLQDVLGLEVDVNPEWQLLLAELDAGYTDRADAVIAVAGTVEAWCRAAAELLDDRKNEEWTETLLEKLKITWSRLRLFIEVSTGDDVSTSWSDDRGGFLVSLPRRQRITPVNLQPLFQAELKDCFADHRQLPPYTASPDADDWDDVDAIDTRVSRLSISGPDAAARHRRGPSVSSTATQPPPDFMPRADALPRPDDLLLKPPYHLMIYSRGAHEIEVQCSHSPTLKFLADYFKRWRRTNHQISSKPPAVEVRLHQCAFGMGASIDRLVLATEHKYGGAFILTPTVILSLVEGVLGYKPVYSDATTWTYRRDVELKT